MLTTTLYIQHYVTPPTIYIITITSGMLNIVGRAGSSACAVGDMNTGLAQLYMEFRYQRIIIIIVIVQELCSCLLLFPGNKKTTLVTYVPGTQLKR